MIDDRAAATAAADATPGAADLGAFLVEVRDIPYGTALTVPRPGGSSLQNKLAAANSSARATAIDRLATWFPGIDFAEQAQNVDDRRFCVADLGDALLDHLRGPETVDRLLADHDHLWGQGGISFSHGNVVGHQPPSVAALRSGMLTTQDRGWLDAGGLADALEAGWTAILHGTDRFDPVLSAVCADLSAAYGARLNTNIYISHGESKGFGPHWDTHDTIIVPVHGKKHWTIFEPEFLSAQKPWIGRTVSHQPVWEGDIEPGMALIIPRGWGHEVGSSADLSIHYTIGVTRLEAHHVFERAEHESGFWPALRADFPFDLHEPVASYEGSVFDDPHGLPREVANVLTPELVERAAASFRARITSGSCPPFSRVFGAVVQGRWDGLGVRVSAPGGIMVADEGPERTALAFAGRMVLLANEAVEAFVALAQGTPVPIDALPPVIVEGDDERVRFVQQLIRGGVAEVAEVADVVPAYR